MTTEQETSDEVLVAIFKALADENRLQMIRMLNNHGSEMSCGQIGEQLDLNKSTISYHFRILREAGLTSTRKLGQNKFVSLNTDVINTYLPQLLDVLGHSEKK